MKIKRSKLVDMVREELAEILKPMVEKETPSPGVADADAEDRENERSGKKKPSKIALEPPHGAPQKGAKPDDGPKPTKEPKELPAGDDKADDELSDEPDEASDDPGEKEDPGDKVSDELVGKTVQSITMEPKSKLMPGAQEIVITFDQIPDPLRILIGKSGMVRFYFRGLHNTL